MTTAPHSEIAGTDEIRATSSTWAVSLVMWTEKLCGKYPAAENSTSQSPAGKKA
jgi:hypothetical protein